LLIERTFHNLPVGQYYFGIFDKAKDGTCCNFGLGYVKLTNAEDGHELFHQDGNYDAGINWCMSVIDVVPGKRIHPS